MAIFAVGSLKMLNSTFPAFIDTYAVLQKEKNIIGSGLIARAFLINPNIPSNVCIYAAGVSNSSCVASVEFVREQTRLSAALEKYNAVDRFVYFSSCSVEDPAACHSPYVQHKLAMEKLVAQHLNFLIVRLPQLAGNTSNPHTLLNYLHTKILQEEEFVIWKEAVRNIIDIEDVVLIVHELVKDPEYRRVVLNVANPISFSIVTLVAMMEKVIGKTAVIHVLDKRSVYPIDTTQINAIIAKIGLSFNNQYVLDVLRKYYAGKDSI